MAEFIGKYKFVKGNEDFDKLLDELEVNLDLSKKLTVEYQKHPSIDGAYVKTINAFNKEGFEAVSTNIFKFNEDGESNVTFSGKKGKGKHAHCPNGGKMRSEKDIDGKKLVSDKSLDGDKLVVEYKYEGLKGKAEFEKFN